MNQTAEKPAKRSVQNCSPRKRDPREKIDAKMQTKICGLLALGYSQNMAAEHFEIDSATIARTAKRDPQFHERLIEARSDASIDALKLIRNTGSQERYWRAAAWMLERRHPDEYGRRAPNTWTADQMMKVLDRVLEFFMPGVPREDIDQIMSEFEEEFSDVAEKVRMSLPEYEPEEEEERKSVEITKDVEPPAQREIPSAATEAAPPSPIPKAPLRQTVTRQTPSRNEPPRQEPSPKLAALLDAASSPDHSGRGQGAVPPGNNLPPAMAAALAESGKRVSCLEQFVQRGPKAATTGGRR